MQLTTADGTSTIITINDDTRIRASGGFLGLKRNELAATSLRNGLPVSGETLQWDGGWVASQNDLQYSELKTASMIHRRTDQRFAEPGAATDQKAAEEAALRGRIGDTEQ